MERNIVRLDLRNWPANEAPPRYMSFIPAPFEKLEVISLGADGARAAQNFTIDDLQFGRTADELFLTFPAIEGPVEAVVLTLDNGNDPEFFIAGDVLSEPPVIATAGRWHLVAALLCGLLLAPLFFDIGFARALRETFPLYHAAFCLLAFVHTAARSGVLGQVVDIPFELYQTITYFSFDLMLGTVPLFARSFIEKDKLKRWHGHALLVAAAAPVINGIIANFVHGLSWNMYGALHWFFLAVFLLLMYFVLVSSALRKSRSAAFLLFSFAPLLAIGVLIVGGGLIPAMAIEFEDYWPQSLSLLFEVVVTAIAVTDRFLSIKRQRDRAVSEARSMEALSERDALTGLLNRRALTVRFDALRAQGFTAMAIVDLDHFKSINDTYGHQIGDDVLKAAAGAMMTQDDSDLLAFRIGGEEFLLLFRGRAMQARAEARREAISAAIASETTIGRKVTASMGYLEASSGAFQDASFETLYERADRLLYEAKEHGRNRMVVEKVKVFQKRTAQRQAA